MCQILKKLEFRSGKPNRLGARFDGEGTNFAAFSARATQIDLCVFSLDGHTEIARQQLPERTRAVWHGFVPGLAPGTPCGFRAHGSFASPCASTDFTTSVHTVLARSPATIVTAQLDDILEHEEAQNMPGTTDEHLNWRRKYGASVEAFPDEGRLRTLRNLMIDHRGKIQGNRAKEMTHEC